MRIHCGWLWDGVASDWRRDADVVCEGGTVVAVTDHAGPADVDWGAYYVLPGLVEAHDHFGIDMGDGAPETGMPLEWRVLKCVKNARAMLHSGITLLRNAGERDNLGHWTRRAIDAGWIEGPRSILSGVPITSTGGHGWFLSVEADGADGVRKAVREQVKHGADMIKLIITGGVTTPGGTLIRRCMTTEEIAAAVDEAHASGLRVGVHAYGGPATSDAIASGVDSIEHGTYLTDSDLDEMAHRGTWLVCTSSVMTAAAKDEHVAAFMRERFGQVARDYASTITRARSRGVRITVGCDTHHCSLHEETAFLVAAGYSPMEAVQACTGVAAQFLGLTGKAGCIQAQSFADVVALRSDPFASVGALSDVAGVVKAGRLVSGGD